MARDRSLEAVGLAVLLAAGAVVWLTRHPDAPWLTRARGWPLVGGLARGFQERWLPPPPAPAAEPPASGGVEVIYLPPPAPPPRRRFDAGRASASPPQAATEGGEVASGLEPPGPLAAEPAEPERLARARALLGGGARGYALGRYALWTDLDDPALVPRWRRLAAAVERAWPLRTGTAPLGAAAETVVLFRDRAAFTAYVAAEPSLAGVDAHGVAGHGLVVLADGGQPAQILDATFAHELAHLLSRRALGPALPPWLGEGLAEDVSHAPPGASGALDFGAVRGVVTRDGEHFRIHGGAAALDRLGRRVAAGGRLATLGELEALDVAEFAAAGTGSERYALVFAWVRFLQSRPELAAGFRAFLAAVREGGPATVAALDAALPRPTGELVGELEAWVLAARAAALERLGAPTALPEPGGTAPRRGAGQRPPESPPGAGGQGARSGSSSRQRVVPSA